MICGKCGSDKMLTAKDGQWICGSCNTKLKLRLIPEEDAKKYHPK